MKRLRILRSHTAHFRFLHECDDDNDRAAGWIPRHREISSPYSYGPTHLVYRWTGRPVIVAETSHRRYEVFEVSERIYATDAEAEAVYCA